ncbi:MAG: iron-containing alcohol dehydrogenase family protein [Acidimicrobiales bacterium]
MTNYTFTVGPEVVYGPGAVSEVAGRLEALGAKHPVIICDAALTRAGVGERVQSSLPHSQVWAGVDGEPSIDLVSGALAAVRERDGDAVVAVGGGSSIDTAKLACVLATNGGELVGYAADWGSLSRPGLPFVAVPTTVGSGSEMTRGAVFKDPARHAKLVIISDHLAPRAAVLDPTLLDTLPSTVTAATGSDALTQAMEGVLSTGANAFTDAFHLQAIRVISWAMPRAVADSKDTEAMGAMQQAAAMVGAALAYSGVGAAHAVANTLGGAFPIPHGVACALMLRPVLRMNAGVVPERFVPIAAALGIERAASSLLGEVTEAVVERVGELLASARVAWRLREFPVPSEELKRVAEEAQAHSDMSTNPRQPTVDEVLTLLQEAW